jgi:quercetin dioxygenase-like cupin family protein
VAERFDKFSEGARRVLQLAQEEAQRFNHNYIGTEHVLLGLLREGEGLAAQALSSLAVDLNKVRDAVTFIIGRGERTTSGDIGLTDRAKRVIELSVLEARKLNSDYIGTEHLLLGLIGEGESIAAGVLESVGVSLTTVRPRLRQLMFPELPEIASQFEARAVGAGMVDQPPSRPAPTRATTNPWLDVGERGGVLRTSLDGVIADLEAADQPFVHRTLMTGPGYECGVVRIAPSAEVEERFIVHDDKDVICQVFQGRGRLRLRGSSQAMLTGDVCRVLANMEHDFVAVDEPLVLFYFTIMVPERQG